jgi:hypothetical protein
LFNSHMNKLSSGGKLKNWDIKYHAGQARRDLDRAKQFVQENQR